MWCVSLSFRPFAPGRAASVAAFEPLAAEVMRALEAIRPRLARVRGFDHAGLVAKLDAAIAAIIADPERFATRIADAHAASRARVEARLAADPWAALDIEWTTYHRSARALLDDPFFWDPGDDHAPVGNDTGADVLDSYRGWRKRHRKDLSGAVAHVERLLDQWEMAETGDDRALLVRDEAFIALAFVQVMLDGEVASDVAARALSAIERQLGRYAAWPDPGARRATLEKMQARLEALR